MPDSVSTPVLNHTAASAETAIPSCAVLVMSCDKYRDLWRPFFTLFWRYWPNCPFPLYLGTTGETYNDERVTTIHAGDYPWSKTFRLCLEQIDTDYVLLLLEDFFLDEPIATRDILEHLKLLHELRGTVLRLYPHPGPDAKLPPHSNIGRLHRLAEYRVSMQPAVWNRMELLGIVRDDESIWDFESKGTTRSQSSSHGFYSTYGAVLPYRHVIERGQWFRSAAERYEKEQIGCDFAARPVMTRAQSIFKAVNARRRRWISAVRKVLLRGRA